MNETRSLSSYLRRIALPLLVALVLVLGTILISGSSLVRIEDVVLNRIVAGTYGTPDWRVQEMNPLLAQLLTLLYQVVPSINWYGVLLLALLVLAAAVGISLTARKQGGLIPAAIIVSPILVLLTNSVFSTTIAALCAAVGALSFMEGLHLKKEGIGRIVLGVLLFVFGAMLSLTWAIIIGVGAVLCWLPCAIREGRMRGLYIGLPIMVAIVAVLFGYSALMYHSPELSAYRSNYALYEEVQHSSLSIESQEWMTALGTASYSEEHADHAHDVDEPETDASDLGPSSFDAVGWTVNDAYTFFTRFSSDTKLTDPEALRTLNNGASHWNFSPSYLFSELFETVKKPQFILLIALFVVSALAVLITSRRRGLIVLVAALIAFGGHVATIAHYYDTFAEIAPFYLLGIAVLLYFFDGEDAKAWLRRVFASGGVRMAVSVIVLVVYAAGLGGVLYYTRITPANSSDARVTAVNTLSDYIVSHAGAEGESAQLFIGDNPHERYKPSTLAAPVRGEDKNLLAGSYDLYSPRGAALMEQYGITNPLVDCLNRDDVGYVLFSFIDSVYLRLSEAYELYIKEPETLVQSPEGSEAIYLLTTYTQEEQDALIAQAEDEAEQAALWAEALAELEAEGFFDQLAEDHTHEEGENHDHDHEEEEDHDHDHEEDVTTPTVSPSATPISNG